MTPSAFDPTAPIRQEIKSNTSRAAWSTITSTVTGALSGAAVGLLSGGPSGAVGGAVGGAVLGATFGTLTKVGKLVTNSFERLAHQTDDVIMRFRDVNARFMKMALEREMQDKRLERNRAQVIGEFVEETHRSTIKFRERWADLNNRLYKVFEPLTRLKHRALAYVLDKTLTLYERLIGKLEKFSAVLLGAIDRLRTLLNLGVKKPKETEEERALRIAAAARQSPRTLDLPYGQKNPFQPRTFTAGMVTPENRESPGRTKRPAEKRSYLPEDWKIVRPVAHDGVLQNRVWDEKTQSWGPDRQATPPNLHERNSHFWDDIRTGAPEYYEQINRDYQKDRQQYFQQNQEKPSEETVQERLRYKELTTPPKSTEPDRPVPAQGETKLPPVRQNGTGPITIHQQITIDAQSNLDDAFAASQTAINAHLRTLQVERMYQRWQMESSTEARLYG